MSMHNFSASHSDPFMAALIALSTSGNALSFVRYATHGQYNISIVGSQGEGLPSVRSMADVSRSCATPSRPTVRQLSQLNFAIRPLRSSPRKLDVFVVNCCVSVFQVLWLLPVSALSSRYAATPAIVTSDRPSHRENPWPRVVRISPRGQLLFRRRLS